MLFRSRRHTKNTMTPLELPYHKTRAGSKPGAWPTVSGNCHTPSAGNETQEMKRRRLIALLTVHLHFTLRPPSAMAPPVSRRRTGRKARPQSLLVGIRDCSKGTAQDAVNLGASSLLNQSNSEICPIGDRVGNRIFGVQTFLFHAHAYSCYTEWAGLTVLAYSRPIIGGKVAHSLLCYATENCCSIIDAKIMASREYRRSRLRAPDAMTPEGTSQDCAGKSGSLQLH